jgi:phosphate transport system substrate-binding protein
MCLFKTHKGRKDAGMTRTVMTRTIVFPLLVLFIAPLLLMSQVQAANEAVTVTGDGSSFPLQVYDKLAKDYKNEASYVTVSYDGTGTSQAIENFKKNASDFTSTEAYLSDAETTANDVLHVPMLAGAVTVPYNLPDVGKRTLQFSPETLAKIFLGEITNWNDAAIQGDNPGRNLPDKPIQVAYFSGSSGATNIFTTYLAEVSGAWAGGPGSGLSVNWPTGAGQPDVNSMVSYINSTDGALGYLDLNTARRENLPTPRVKNQQGNWIRPSMISTSYALQDIGDDDPDDLRIRFVNSGHKNAYPIVGLSWVLLRETSYPNLDKARAITNFIYWLISDDEAYKTQQRMGYTVLPTEAFHKAQKQLMKVTAEHQVALTRGSTELPTTMADIDGTNVEVTKADSIITINYSTAEIIFSMGLGDRVVATDGASWYPEEVTEVPEIGRMNNLDTSKIIEKDPDLVIGYDFERWYDDKMEILRNAGITVLMLPMPAEEGMQDGIPTAPTEKVRQVAQALGVPEHGEALVRKLNDDYAESKKKLEGVSGQPRVLSLFYFTEAGEEYMAGPESSCHAMIESAGAINAAAEVGVTGNLVDVNAEQILAMQPDVITINELGYNSLGGIEGVLSRWPALENTPAGENCPGSGCRIYAVEIQAYFGMVPRTAQTLGYFIDILHRDICDAEQGCTQ